MRYSKFGRWFRGQRTGRGLKSAAALSRLAGLDEAYVSDLERGKARPRTETVERLADAMKLAPDERAELHRRARLAGEPDAVRDAIESRHGLDVAMWRHLPALLFRLERPPNPNWEFEHGVLIGTAVPPLAEVLAWRELTRANKLTRTQLSSLRAAYSAAYLEARPHVPSEWGLASGHAADYAYHLAACVWRNMCCAKLDTCQHLGDELKSWRCRIDLSRRGMAVPHVTFVFRDVIVDEHHGIHDRPALDVVTKLAMRTAERFGELLPAAGFALPIPTAESHVSNPDRAAQAAERIENVLSSAAARKPAP